MSESMFQAATKTTRSEIKQISIETKQTLALFSMQIYILEEEEREREREREEKERERERERGRQKSSTYSEARESGNSGVKGS